ncbi:mannosyltransferase putative-domain-containing protein [Chaetomium tenue]|uniref:Mannosyltransferase putative-domain-containing protein n=1 Tax=Chaetomium tenue TaxID=1854479 RepID=A0ACB7PM71_9PEZI|nr:mannosyltransferase putative-domain-containing protein [Chaetomium globosum]
MAAPPVDDAALSTPRCQVPMDQTAQKGVAFLRHLTLRPRRVFPRVGKDKWASIPVPEFERFQWKVLSILVSSFQNVLFLDADCLSILNPDPIFHQGSKPFTSAGLITWPDFWTSTASPLFYKVAGDIDIPPITSRATSESGIIHYYPLLSQHGAGEGDKETFLQAALVLEALRQKGAYQQPTAWMRSGAGAGVKKGYYDVKKPPVVHGRSARGKWTGMFLLQMDPMEDYRAVMAAIKVSKRDEAEGIVIEDFLTNSTFLDTLGDLKPEYHGHSMFFHHSGVKPDFTRILDEKWGLVKTDEEGRYVRMWDHIGWVIDTLGRDVEKLLWEDSMQVYCQEELAQFKRLQNVCVKMHLIHGQLYA